MARPKIVTEEVKNMIAILHSRGRAHREIAAQLELSESAVSKAVREAYEAGRVRLVFNPEGLTESDVNNLESKAGLRTEHKERLARVRKDNAAIVQEPDILVFDAESAETSARGWTARLEHFGRAVAPHILGYIGASRTVGTSWGKTLLSVVRALRHTQRLNSTVRFIPLCGEMLDGPPRKASASNLASRLDEIVNGDTARSHSYWLAGVPSHCPIHGRPGQHRKFTVSEAAVVREYIENLPAYRKIFTGSDGAAPLADSLDMILTSCGPKERPLGYEGVQWLESIGIARERASRLVAGDISGILLKAPKLTAEESRLIDSINDAWMGAKIPHLARCARRAMERSLPGVVVCAIGANKASSVLEIIRLGIANRLLMDTDCWRQLERKL